MIVLNNGDKIRGDAGTAAEVDFTISGFVGTTATPLAGGQLANAIGDLYTSGADATIVTGIILCNTGAGTNACNLYRYANGGTTERIGPKDVSLLTGYSLLTDGVHMVIVSASGEVVQTYSLHASSHENGGADEVSVTALSGLLADDQHVLDAEVVTAAKTVKLDDFTAPDDNTDLDASAAKHGLFPKLDHDKLDGIAASADVTGSNAPQAHKDLHDPQDGSDALDAAAPSELAGVQAAGEGSSHSLARADHAHQIQASIADDHLVTIDHAAAADDDYAKLTASGLEGRSYAEVLTDIFSVDMPENLSMNLDDALSADGKWCGTETEDGTAGETLVFGDCVYFKAADSRWWHTDADAEATAKPKVGFVILAAGTGGNATKVLLRGKIRADAKFPTLTIGAPAFIGTAVGEIQVAAPSGAADIVRIVGHGNTANELAVNISPVWIKIAA